MKLIIFSDGGARGNPGAAAIGVVIKNEQGKALASYGEYLGNQTNNYAEYAALISGLKRAKELGATKVECVMDSELVVKQMKLIYKVKEPTLQKLFVQAFNAASTYQQVVFRHVPREKNIEADFLVNQALDRAAFGDIKR